MTHIAAPFATATAELYTWHAKTHTRIQSVPRWPSHPHQHLPRTHRLVHCFCPLSHTHSHPHISHMCGPGRDYWISLFINDPIHSQTVTFICTPSPASPSSVLLLFLALSSFQPSSFYSSPCNTLLIHWTNKSMAGLFSRIVITTKMFSWLDKIDSIIINIFLLGKR